LRWGVDFSTRPLVPRGLGRNDGLVENGEWRMENGGKRTVECRKLSIEHRKVEYRVSKSRNLKFKIMCIFVYSNFS
ncbi:MAG: hypothetical protein LBG31_05885, partial [Prevotellaceae bacterium]|jgi:hypothetical protein|nr:hypothetical protein [Prevotellaceae bacterium]